VRAYTDFNRFQRNIPFPGLLAGYEVRSSTIGADASLRWDLSPSNRLTLGTQYRDNVRVRVTTSAIDGQAPVVNSPYSVLSGFVVDEFDLTQWLTVLGGISHDRYSSGARITAPRAAAVLRLDYRTTLKLIYGQAFREPTVLERVTGSDGLPNPDLRPERINSYEVVAQRQVSHGVLATVTGFFYDVDELVETVLDPSDSLLHYQNAGSIRAHGVEANLQARLPRGHNGYVSWSHSVASNEAHNLRLENSPRDLIKLGLVSPIWPWLTAAVEARYESSGHGDPFLRDRQSQPELVSAGPAGTAQCLTPGDESLQHLLCRSGGAGTASGIHRPGWSQSDAHGRDAVLGRWRPVSSPVAIP
jgi:iron complex outermembrane receptor protein